MKTINQIAIIAVGLILSAPLMAEGYGSNGSKAKAKAASTSISEQGNAQNITTTNNSTGSDMGRMVPGVIAPALTTTLSETCMGSTSMGASGVGFGFSIGSTWRDEACVRRLDSREIRSFGAGLQPRDAVLFHFAAKERMCEADKIREAFERVAKMTNRQDALCQTSVDDAKTAEANRAANRAAGIAVPVTEQVATRESTSQEMECYNVTDAN